LPEREKSGLVISSTFSVLLLRAFASVGDFEKEYDPKQVVDLLLAECMGVGVIGEWSDACWQKESRVSICK
jgi:hypothetical protein